MSTSSTLNRAVGIAGALSILAAAGLVLYHFEEKTVPEWAHEAPPASDALEQAVDLTRITQFHYVNDRTLEITDDLGRHFKMELTEACPGLAEAKDFSLVTDGYRNLDRFTAIGVKGSICTFKDFAPMSKAETPAS